MATEADHIALANKNLHGVECAAVRLLSSDGRKNLKRLPEEIEIPTLGTVVPIDPT